MNVVSRLLRSVLLYLFVAVPFGYAARSDGQDVTDTASQPSVAAVANVPTEKLTLAGVDGSTHSFKDLLGDGQAVCYTFLYPNCPMSKVYCPVLNLLAAEFGKQGVTFVGVICESEAIDDLDAFKKEFSISFPIFLDANFAVANLLDATVTPESFLVSREGTIAYAGRIDSRYKVRGVRSPAEIREDLREAIVDVLAAKPVRIPRLVASGCPIDRPELPQQTTDSVPTATTSTDGTVTFYRDVLPILHNNCQRCHSPGQVAPFSLMSFEDATDWMETALEEIDARRMPPAQVESDLELSGTRPLSLAEVATLRQWVASKTPEGNPADTPILAPFPRYGVFDETLGPPDIVINLPSVAQLGPHGADIYRNFVFPLNRPDDLHVRALQLLPSNLGIVHHALIGYLDNATCTQAVKDYGGRAGMSNPLDQMPGFWSDMGSGFKVPPVRPDGIPRTSFVSGYVPGNLALVSPPNVSILIPAGSDIVAQMHYHRRGKLETDSSQIGIWLDKDPPSVQKKLMNLVFLFGSFQAIPIGVKDFRVTGRYTIEQDAEFVGVAPHAHSLCSWMTIKATLPGQTNPILLVRVPKFDFNWQSAYWLKKPLHLPKGTVIDAEVSYDNSADNPHNPYDPPQTVWLGESTFDEMLLPMLLMASDKPLDPMSKSFVLFNMAMARSKFMRRLIDREHKYRLSPDGIIELDPSFYEETRPQAIEDAKKK